MTQAEQQTTPSISSIFNGALNTGVDLLGAWGSSKINKTTAATQQQTLGAETKAQNSKTVWLVVAAVVGLVLLFGALRFMRKAA